MPTIPIPDRSLPRRAASIAIACVAAFLMVACGSAGVPIADDRVPGAPPPAPPTYDGPIVITEGGTYRGAWSSLDASVPAVEVRTSEPVVLESSWIRSAGTLISAPWTDADLTVRDVVGEALDPGVAGRHAGRFLAAERYQRIVVENSWLEGTSGIYLHRANPGAEVAILRNQVRDVDGRISDGRGGYDGSEMVQFVQLNEAFDVARVEIAWNEVVNRPYESVVEDVISLYEVYGRPDQPVRVHDNFIWGAYPIDPARDTYSGGGIMIGDQGGAHVHATGNHVVGTTNYGIAVAGGYAHRVHDNRVVSCGRIEGGAPLAAQNVGVYILDLFGTGDFADNRGEGNVIGWNGREVVRNDYYVPDATEWRDTVALRGDDPIHCDLERAEHDRWRARADAAGIDVGVRR